MFLNFNYTNILESYINPILNNKTGLKNFSHPEIEVNYIHGSLDEKHGKPIFGIGDEHRKDYESLKDSDILTSIFRFNKSIWYLKNENYKNLFKYLDDVFKGGHKIFAGPTDVEIYGHSCGISS